MKWVLAGIGGYFLLVFLADQAANAAAASCGGVGSPGMLHCPAYDAATAQWSWLPRPHL
jgi:hypothetical protein